jgi:hypothetical protein
MAIEPLVPAPVVVLPEEGLVGVEVGKEAGAVEGLSEQVGAASASGKANKRESAAASMPERENGRGKKDREGEKWGELALHFSVLL